MGYVPVPVQGQPQQEPSGGGKGPQPSSQPKISQFLGIGGGHNDGVAKDHCADYECPNVTNFYTVGYPVPPTPWVQTGNKLRRRPGSVALSAFNQLLGAEAAVSVHFYRDNFGIYQTLIGSDAGSSSGLYKLNPLNKTLSSVPNPATNIGPFVSLPWLGEQFHSVLYVARKGSGLFRYDGQQFAPAGIPAPNQAAVLADGGGGGNLDAGAYVGVFTYYNSSTTAESNYSPPSNSQTIVINHTLSWTLPATIPTSLLGKGVDSIRLYRTLPNQTNQYFFVAMIPITANTYSPDNTIQVSLGGPASVANGVPPAGAQDAELWLNRLWVHDGNYVYYSEDSLPESFKATSKIPVFINDGGKIMKLLAFGDRIVVLKTNGIHYIDGSDPTTFDLKTLSDRHGCIAANTAKSAEGLFYWFDGSNVYQSDGTQIQAISDVKIFKALSQIPKSLASQACAGVYPATSQYLLSIPTGTGANTFNNLIVGFNYKYGSWFTYTYPYLDPSLTYPTCPSFFGDFYDANYNPTVLAVFYNGVVYDLINGGLQDDADQAAHAGIPTPIACNIDLKALSSPFKIGLRRIHILTDTVNESMSFSALLNGSLTPYKTRTISLSSTPHEWKRVNLSTMNSLAAWVQLRIQYSGKTQIDISGVGFETQIFKRGGQPL